MESEPSAPRILGPRDGKFGSLGMTGVRFLIGGPESGERFALVEHPMEPWALAGPLHRHRREDEYTFVLEGRIGAELGGVVVYGNPGNLIFKPRNQWHTFWNESDQPGRVLEIISSPRQAALRRRPGRRGRRFIEWRGTPRRHERWSSARVPWLKPVRLSGRRRSRGRPGPGRPGSPARCCDRRPG
jgi:mannose-6-phosphate isomerase-like protein (cupin superfamily)